MILLNGKILSFAEKEMYMQNINKNAHQNSNTHKSEGIARYELKITIITVHEYPMYCQTRVIDLIFTIRQSLK